MKIIYEDDELLVVDKPAGMDVIGLMEELIKENPGLKRVGEEPRYGLVHRLDKETSGVILVAKSSEALIFFQKQFKNRVVEKKYIGLVNGIVKSDQGGIETLIGRGKSDKKKQRVYLPAENIAGARVAITDYAVIKRFDDCTLLEIWPKTGRKHQIRVHLAHINHPIIADRVYGFRSQKKIEGLNRHFLHAACLKVEMMNGETKEFSSELPANLKEAIDNL